MRLPRPTTRRLMVLVGVVGFFLGGCVWVGKMLRVRDRHLQRATLHSRGLAAFRFEHAQRQAMLRRGPSPFLTQYVREIEPWIDYHTRMESKYLRAARRPWLPAPPDPPPPE